MSIPEKRNTEEYQREVFQLQVYRELEGYGMPMPLQALKHESSHTPFTYAYLFHIIGAIVGGIAGLSLGIAHGNFVEMIPEGVMGIFIGWFAGAIFSIFTEQFKNLTRSVKRTKSKKIARKLVNNKDIRKLLCPALKSVSTDVWEIAKVATPILYAAAVAGKVSIPHDPIVFAALTIVIARMGIASLCVENDKNQAAHR
jgi:hypothetical protein